MMVVVVDVDVMRVVTHHGMSDIFNISLGQDQNHAYMAPGGGTGCLNKFEGVLLSVKENQVKVILCNVGYGSFGVFNTEKLHH